MLATAGEARHRPANAAGTRKIAPAMWTSIEIWPGSASGWKWEIVTTGLVRDAEISTRLSPLRSMRRDAPTPRAKLRKQMRQLMPESPLDLVGPMFAQARIH